MLDIDEDTKRVLEGFEREKARTGPPEGFPGFNEFLKVKPVGLLLV